MGQYIPPQNLPIPTGQTVSVTSREAIGPALNVNSLSYGNTSTHTANRAIYIPFVLNDLKTYKKLWVVTGSVSSGNFDLGIYSSGGTRLVSTGSTAMSGTDTYQSISVTNGDLQPNTLYYMAWVVDNATATFRRWAWNTLEAGAAGCKQETSAFPLPSTATFSAPAWTVLPFFGISFEAAL